MVKLTKGTVGVAVSYEDPDAPAGTWWHWFVYNVPASTKVWAKVSGPS
ncbi:MAG: hypothetical protein IPJ49_30805 [Candidatus Obscuribacter sp.]|nr:hypothetical protein [Candidatus Obscuribacter sp.]